MLNISYFEILKKKFIFDTKFVYICGLNGENVIFCNKSDEVFSYGTNTNGCLGLKHSNTVENPTKVNELCTKQIEKICFGYHVLVLTKSGECYSCGRNSEGQLGNGTTTQSNVFNKIDGLVNKSVNDISCGHLHSIVLLQTGELYAFGFNSKGELGVGNNTNQLIPTLINGLNNEKIIAISCGAYHSLALTESGQLYSWGQDSAYQLGDGTNTNRNTPTKVNLTNDVIVKRIVCGKSHSLALSNMGEIYAFGLNTSGQLGIGNKTNQTILFKLNIKPKIIDIYSDIANEISIAKSENGNFYIWGDFRNESILKPKIKRFESIFEVYSNYAKIPITPEILFLEEKPVINKINESISGLFDDQKESDFKFKLEDKYIFVHKLILKTRCEHFRSMFSENWDQNDTKEAKIDLYSYNVYYAFLKYLYSDFVDINPEEAIDLLDLANSYCEEELKQKCFSIIINELKVENFCFIYSAAVKYELNELEDFCIQFASHRVREICKSVGFREMDKDSMCKLITRFAENEMI
jgi:RCC1 and BTB domain-containing protein